MGAAQSVRATAFQRPKSTSTESFIDDEPDDHHISISNKMVERLVEDATLSGSTTVTSQPSPRGDFRDKIYIEKLKCMDESHSEITGITLEDLNAIANRIDMRTANMVSVEPVCAECKQRVIDCYNENKNGADVFKCWETVGAFTKCVQEAASSRLRARTQRDARERARRHRHIAHAREHALRDLASN
ncbi:uncharacterized protein LOC126055924 [Helicoverpa armigera]|uniref:uncharacterized protein LOC126055924 n=1 Tax=Helicoverpa armigera TaxID=29058 RepID=UPI0021138196|nr:uncharacterized protein LOC126055924 [Helicoverpa armigera]XP_049702819.1 uncharacterized protein LOC126055924 [Helicoverpa armigera]